jgi:hypothetical protein
VEERGGKERERERATRRFGVFFVVQMGGGEIHTQKKKKRNSIATK